MIKRSLLLSTVSALLLSLPWYSHFSGLLLLAAWIPLLVLEYLHTQRAEKGCWKYYALTFLLWNGTTTFWIGNATLFGAVAAITVNSLQMFLIFALFRWIKRRTNYSVGYTFLVVLWIAWEYFYFNAEISWPWLVLGNGFAKDIRLVQWYEYTGVLGGSLWVWLTNILFFRGFLFFAAQVGKTKKAILNSLLLFSIIAAPCIYSLCRFYNYEEEGQACLVTILQPNIDPYNKFEGMSEQIQLDIMLDQAAQATDSATDFVIAPETAISRVVENNPLQSSSVMSLLQFLTDYPQTSFIIGTTSRYFYNSQEAPTSTARKIGNLYYDVFNSAMHIKSFDDMDFYHKSKLVIGVEMLPYPQLLKFLGDWSIDLGGSVGSYGTQAERDIFTSVNKDYKMGVAICYESVYGEFYTDYIRNGANVMAIITNDAWWGNTAGYKQHLSYASLRAIETRRSIARCANTGISAIINQRGEITERTQWWEKAVIKNSINTNERLTFYVCHGNYIGRIAVFILCLLGLYTASSTLRQRYMAKKTL